MTDIVGPASALNAVGARPSDGRQYGATDTFFKDCSSASTQDGTQVSAAWLNQVTGFFRNLIRTNGLKADGVTPVVAYDQSDNMVLNGILQFIQRGQGNYAVDTGTADALLATPAVAPAEYKAGMRFLILKNPGVGANVTVTPTVNLGLGNLTIVKDDASPLGIGDLKKGGVFEIELDGGGNARLTGLMTISDVLALMQAGTGVYAVDAGIVNALVVTLSPPATAYVAGLNLFVKVANTNTGASTINVNGLGAKSIINDEGLGNLTGAEMSAGKVVQIVYDGSAFRLLTSQRTSSFGGGAFGSGGILGATGTTNWVVPAGVTKVRVRCYGAGGGGGGTVAAPSAASGGGAGAYVEGIYQVTPGSTIVVTAGAVGAGAAAGTSNTGTSGGSSSFGSFCSASGGTGGVGANTNGYQGTYVGQGGAPNGGNTLNIYGNPGTIAFQFGSTGLSGAGGAGYGTSGGAPSGGAGNPASIFGGGGGGGANGGGGAGGVGIVILEW